MPSPESLIARLKKTLEAYAKSGRPESMTALGDILLEIENSGALKAVGCLEKDCAICAWGVANAREWENKCRLWTFAEAVEDAAYAGRRGNAAVQAEAARLLEAMAHSPFPGKKKS